MFALSSERLNLRATSAGVRLEVEVKVRASRTAILGVKSERLSVALAAPPVDNAANDALCRLLGERLSIPRRDITIVSGEKSRRKLLELRGLTPQQVVERLSLPG
jgi:uncharacterized protein (TIGR00251 family)